MCMYGTKMQQGLIDIHDSLKLKTKFSCLHVFRKSRLFRFHVKQLKHEPLSSLAFPVGFFWLAVHKWRHHHSSDYSPYCHHLATVTTYRINFLCSARHYLAKIPRPREDNVIYEQCLIFLTIMFSHTSLIKVNVKQFLMQLVYSIFGLLILILFDRWIVWISSLYF